ncbi:MAG TPA: four helix bundle protein [Chthoniobacterales bacterium]
MGLIVWQRALALFELVWDVAFVKSTIDFKLRAQLADAAQSVSANISEGYGRRSVKEYIQYLYIALGSLAETMTRSIGLMRTGQIKAERFEEIDALHYEVENRLLRLIEKLEQKRDDGDWTDRIAEDPDEYAPTPQTPNTPTPQNSITPTPQNSKTPPLHLPATPHLAHA